MAQSKQPPKLDPGYKARQEVQSLAYAGDPDDARSPGYAQNVAAPTKADSDYKKDALEEPALKQFFEAMMQSAEQHRQPRDAIWQQCWDIYNNEFDWSQKAWWQHKAPLPKVRVSVDKAVALFRKTLLKTNPFYGIKAESKVGRTKGRYTMLLNDYHFSQAHVYEEMVSAFKVGLITSTAVSKIWWMQVRDFKPKVYTDIEDIPTYEFGIQTGSRQESKKRVELEDYYRGALGFQSVNPFNLWVVPNTRNRCMIERTTMTLSELKSLTKTKDNPNGVYEEDAVNELSLRASGTELPGYDSQARNPNEGIVDANTYLRTVTLKHYWGDIYDCEGRLVMPDATFTFGGFGSGDMKLVRKPRPNPFYHKLPPFVLGSPYEVPFSTYNRGMVEDIMEIAKSIVEMANLIADGALYDALKAFAIDADQLDDPAEARQGMYPGKTFVFRSGSAPTPNAQVVQTVNVGKIPQEANNMIQLFERYYQEGSYINEWVGGFGSKTDRTLGEVNIKTQSALEGLDEAARNLETTYMEPALTMATQVIYQFHNDYMLPRLTENYPQISMLLNDMSPAERYSTMMGDYGFEVKGLSIMIDRAQRLGEFKEILQLLSYLPGFVERINPDTALEEILAPVGWDPNKLLLAPTSSAGMVPLPGALPSPQGAPGVPPAGGAPQMGRPPMGPSGRPMSGMNQANAQQGAIRGGAINNPVAAPMMNPQILQRMILQRLMSSRNRPGPMGQPVL